MLDAIKNAAVARTVEALRADLDQAGRSLAALRLHLESLSQMDAQTAWRLIHGLQASLYIAEQTLRDARRSPGMPAGPLRRAVTTRSPSSPTCRSSLSDISSRSLRRAYNLPPQGTRWTVEPPR